MVTPSIVRRLSALVLMLGLLLSPALPAAAGGENPPTFDFALDGPTISLDANDQVIISVTLTCWGNTVIEGQEAYFALWAGVGQEVAGGGAWAETHCAQEPQDLTLTIASQTAIAFHPGLLTGYLEFELITSSSALQAIGPIEEILAPVQAAN